MCDYLRLGSIPLIRKSLYTVDLDLIQSCCCIAAMVRPLIYKELQAAILSLGIPLGLPNFFPLRFASARPDWHLSIIIDRFLQAMVGVGTLTVGPRPYAILYSPYRA